ncbi:MAG: flagellar basal-body rod protein FlgF [Pseudomonadales bacterium]|nr:flagellar basal-body rod protein FlgF [Pseudomonadales bacterium]
MEKALYTLMTGANRSLQAQAVFANNLANINTVGFRADLIDATRIVDEPVTPGQKYTESDTARKSDFSVGQIEETGRVLDIAIATEGFFAVQAADGTEAYTRAGDLQIDSSGLLITGRGDFVLGDGGPISIPTAEKISIGADGTISVQELGQNVASVVEIDRIKLVKPEIAQLSKGADGLFRIAAGQKVEEDASVQIRSGFVERSNVNAVSMLTDIIASARQFEMQVKAMKTVEENSESSARIMQMS